MNVATAPSQDTAALIIQMERVALERWAKGDPDGFLEISDPEVTYFDPFQSGRLNSREELRKLYDGLRGKVGIEHFEIIDPKVQIEGNVAVLTFNFASGGSEAGMRWNTTEVYRYRDNSWQIIHTNWSLTQPKTA